MQRLPIRALTEHSALPYPLLHGSGVLLRQSGEPLTADMIACLKNIGITDVVVPDKSDSLDMIKRSLVYAPMALDAVDAGMVLEQPLYAETGALLLNANTPVPKSFRDSMTKRNITTVYLPRSPEERQSDMGAKAAAALQEIDPRNQKPAEKLIDRKTYSAIKAIQFVDAEKEDLDAQKLRTKINTFKRIDVLPDGQPFAEHIMDRPQTAYVTAEERQAFTDVVQDSRTVISEVYEELGKGGKRIDYQGLDEVACHSMGGVIRNRDLMMLCSTQSGSQDYLINHSLAVAVVALNIAAGLGFSNEQVKTLAYGALLADTGMLMVPEEIREKPEGLSNREHAEIKRHPALGLDMLQRITRIPREVPYIVYQSHERNNGTGYPCGKKSVVIHMFARIVGVADAYTAMVADRPYRIAATPYAAMTSMLQMCSRKLFDQGVVRSLLECNALCPVGSFVRLSNGSLGRVISANRESYMRPVIAILADASGKAIKPSPRINLLERQDVSIKQVIDPREKGLRIDPFAGF